MCAGDTSRMEHSRRSFPTWRRRSPAPLAPARKSVETRTWQTPFRGRFVVCATKGLAPWKEYYDPLLRRLSDAGFDLEPYLPKNVARGVALAVANLQDCRPMTEADEARAWIGHRDAAGDPRWAWVLERKPVKLRHFPVHGRQTWFRVASSLLAPEVA